MVEHADAVRRSIPLKVLDVLAPAARDLYDCDLALVRPDKYVAWRGNSEPGDSDALLARLVGA